MSIEKLRIKKGDDMHCHLRRGKMMRSVAWLTVNQFKRVVIMPNTDPPILTADDVLQYSHEIGLYCPPLERLMTIQINNSTTLKIISEAREAGVVAGKVYPQGVTTNSQNGVTNFRSMYPVFEKMQEAEMVLSLHGEYPDPKIFCLEREFCFLPTLACLAQDFPTLKIVLEHITTREAVEMVSRLPDNVAATITAHHLVITLDDVVGGLISPHNFCKPIAKKPDDRRALIEAATSGSPKIFFGSDSAPHLREKKECSCGCAGVFSAPVALPLLVQIFEEHSKLDHLENFVSKFGADFYGLPQSSETIELVKKDWVVPNDYDGIIPFMAGQTLHWQIAE
jgi:dihydroorotase